eukprot:2363292-Pyramimonas_sp.AAC.1
MADEASPAAPPPAELARPPLGAGAELAVDSCTALARAWAALLGAAEGALDAVELVAGAGGRTKFTILQLDRLAGCAVHSRCLVRAVSRQMALLMTPPARPCLDALPIIAISALAVLLRLALRSG